MGQMAEFSGLVTKKINDLENYIMPQIDYQIMWHIILKLYIRISSLFQDDKGQLISECLFCVLNFPKNQRKI